MIVFERVSKKFHRGPRHDSLRDLIPATVMRPFRTREDDVLEEDEFWALRDVSFEVKAGEALGIVGANGAGKSTALKVLTKVMRPTTGQRSIKGRVGALIEIAAGFHPELTGRENVFLQGAIMGMKRVEIAARFEEIVEFAGVSDFIETPVKRYSSGMNARLGFAIAAHLRPDALIIDEVLSVGDLAFQQKCFDRMTAFKRQGIAIVLVSHNLPAVAALCNKAIYLASEVKASGQPNDVIGTYVQASQKIERTPGDGPMELVSASFVESGRDIGTYAEVGPGTEMTLRATIRCRQPLDDVTVGFSIHRSADQLLVYHGHLHRKTLSRDGPLSGECQLDMHFRAHLTREHYYVSLYALDNPTQEYVLSPRQVAMLAVEESRSKDGVADVDLSVTLVKTATR